jgi:hypothetical protein
MRARPQIKKGGQFVALFNESIIDEVTAVIRKRHTQFENALGEQTPGEEMQQSPLQRDLKLLVGVANGEHNRTDAMVRRVELALGRVLDLLVGNALGTGTQLPDDFWRTDMGVIISRARWWISIDDLITISNAAALAFGQNSQANRMRISRAIDNGLLEWVPDPSVSNPQQNRRVFRSQVERMRDLSRLPEVG